MNRLKTLPLLLLLLFACKQEENNDSESSFFWTPKIQLEKGNEKATLHLTDPRPFTEYVGAVPSNPDFFEVHISENNKDFSVYKKVDVKVNSTEISGLKNDRPYYIFVTAHKNGCVPDSSNKVMTVPSIEYSYKKYLEDVEYAVERISTSNDGMHMSFMSNNYLNNSGGDFLYYRTKNPGSIYLIERDSHSASWSNRANKLVYLTEIKEGIFMYPYKLKLFDVNKMNSTTVFQIPFNEYYIKNPKFIPNKDIITFLSSENNKGMSIYDLWSIDLESGEKIKIVDFEDEGFELSYEYVLNNNGNELYMDGRFISSKSSNDIYKMNVNTKAIEPVIKSQWQDKIPSLSPDNTKLLFVSDRSGEDEIWLLNLNDQKLYQITGGNNYSFDSRYSNIQWLNNEEIVITAFSKSNPIAFKITID